MDVVRITIYVPDQAALNRVLTTAHVSLDCGPPKRDERGLFKLDLYATKAEADKLAALPYEHEVDRDFGKVLAARQAEVSRGDRFQGGKIKPVGLGIKR